MMRDHEHMRCLCNIERYPGVEDFIYKTAQASFSNVVYSPEAAEMDDLDYVDRVQAFADKYDREGYRYHCGSLWAQRGQDLIVFWHIVQEQFGEAFDARIPIIFTRDTIPNPLYD